MWQGSPLATPLQSRNTHIFFFFLPGCEATEFLLDIITLDPLRENLYFTELISAAKLAEKILVLNTEVFTFFDS